MKIRGSCKVCGKKITLHSKYPRDKRVIFCDKHFTQGILNIEDSVLSEIDAKEGGLLYSLVGVKRLVKDLYEHFCNSDEYKNSVIIDKDCEVIYG